MLAPAVAGGFGTSFELIDWRREDTGGAFRGSFFFASTPACLAQIAASASQKTAFSSSILARCRQNASIACARARRSIFPSLKKILFVKNKKNKT
jgi:hypothetical protein